MNLLAMPVQCLAPAEHARCFVSRGTVQSRKSARPRPVPSVVVSTLLSGGAHPF